MSAGPGISAQAAAYALRELARRAGVEPVTPDGNGFEALGLPVTYAQPESLASRPPGLVIIPCRAGAWGELLRRPPNSLDWLPGSRLLPWLAGLPFSSLPVLFWGEGHEGGASAFARLEGRSLVVQADLVSAALFLLTRWEEGQSPRLDAHGRFPAAESCALRQGFLDLPLLDNYGLALREWLKALLPGWRPAPPRPGVIVSHDVDALTRSSGTLRAARLLGAAGLRALRGKAGRAELSDALTGLLRPDRERDYRGHFWLAERSARLGLRDTFYFMGAQPGPYDSGYDLRSPRFRRLLAAVNEGGHRLGFHPGYRTLDDYERFGQEKERLERALGQPVEHVRQHYLRFQAPHSWRVYEKAGLKTDSSLGFADREGFRAGTSRPFRPFDLEQDRELKIVEIPLIAMDNTLYQYRGLSPQQGEQALLELAEKCFAVGGTFTLLWHNSSLRRELEPWTQVYARVLERLSGLLAQQELAGGGEDVAADKQGADQ